MSTNVDAMVHEGINAYKTGRKDEARALLIKATELDQYSEQAWLWLSGLMDTPDDQRTCLENVLAINPNNERAKQGLSYLTGQTSAGNVSPFSASSAPPSDYPPSAPTSVEWGAPVDEAAGAMSPAWAAPRPLEPTGAALDDWVSNLNLPVNDAMDAAPAFTGSSTSPFGDFDLDDDDEFTSGPFGAPPLSLDDEDDKPRTMALPTRRSPVPRESPVPSERVEPAPRRSRARRDEGSLLRDDSESGEGDMFGYIPSEIPATRLPGTVERAPVLLTLGIIVLVVLNLGLGIFIMWSIFT